MTGRIKDRYDCIVVGAGPAGLAASRELSRRGVHHLVLERGAHVGQCWRNAYDSLRLHTGKHLSALPGLRFSRTTPLFPSRNDFVTYLDDYVRHFRLPVAQEIDVTCIRRTHEWQLDTTAGTLHTRALVMATGLMSNPAVPSLAGQPLFQGSITHSVGYRRPEHWAGKRVLVVGVGNSGGEIASELAHHGINVTIAVRSGANVVPLTIAGLPVQYLATLVRQLPRPAQEWVVERIRRRNEARRPLVLPRAPHSPLDNIPLIGFHLVDAIRAGKVSVRPAIAGFTHSGVRFADGTVEDFDAVILATGFRPALQPLGDLVQTDDRGFAVRSDRVRSAQYNTLFLIGHNYDASGGLRNIARDAPLAAHQIALLLQ
ncbi:MAG: flavin-containing monooxygenase [Longimicrobiales bacterium]